MNDRIFINAVDMDGAPVHVAVQQGRITSMASECPVLPHAEVVDVAGHVLLPGFVDGQKLCGRPLAFPPAREQPA